VPGVCTCGAQLPPDARFCHKCGKPQRDEPLLPEQFDQIETQSEAPAPPEPAPAPVQAMEPQRIGFHNGPAVRIAVMVGTLAFLLSMASGQLALPQAFALVWLVAAGFLSVFLYRRRTGQRLSVRSGAHLGWISGVFGFVIVTMLLTVTAVMMSEPAAVSAMRDQMKTHGISEANADQMIQLFRSWEGIAGALLVSFLIFTVLPAVGGAVGAKLLDRD
jgi:zinc ribbon protein